jgi:hypothetical protein
MSKTKPLSATQVQQMTLAMQTLGINEIDIEYKGWSDNLKIRTQFSPDEALNTHALDRPFEFETSKLSWNQKINLVTSPSAPNAMTLREFVKNIFFHSVIAADGLEEFWVGDGGEGDINVKLQDDGTLLYENVFTYKEPTSETHTRTLSIAGETPSIERPRA